MVWRHQSTVGEGPAWDDAAGVVWWVDIPSGDLFALEVASGTRSHRRLPGPLGAVAPTTDGRLVCASGHGIGTWTAADGYSHRLELPAPDHGPGVQSRLNDIGVDPTGSLWLGSVVEGPGGARAGAGQLYRLDAQWRVTSVLSGTTVSNGIGFSPDGRMYFADSGAGTIDVLDVDLATGACRGRSRLVTFGPDDGVGDGLCVDVDGYVWVAMWGGGAVRRYSPDGRLDHVQPIGCSLVTSCTFGDADLAALYVTTARVDLSADQLADEPDAGSLFRWAPGITGNPVASFAG